MEAHGIKYHQYADDTQLYTEVRSLDSTQTEALSKCVAALTFWFLDNGLQLNSSKTEAMIFGTRPGLSKLGPVSSLDIGGDVAVRESIKILGVHLDPTLSMDNQVKAINQSMQLPHPCSPPRPPRPDTRISQVDRPRPRYISSRLLQLAAVWHIQVKSQQTTAHAEWSCASRAPSCLELQLGTLAQTASLAPGSAKDQVQDGTYYIQREILQAAFLSLQSSGQLHAITEPEVWGTTSSSDSSPEVCGSQTQLLFWRANRLEQSQFENSRSRLTRVIQDTSKDRTV